MSHTERTRRAPAEFADPRRTAHQRAVVDRACQFVRIRLAPLRHIDTV